MRALFGLVLLGVGLWVHLLTWGSFVSLRKVREAQRVPLIALQPGPAVVEGEAREADSLGVTSRYRETRCLYYECTLTEEYRDSDGDRRTRTLERFEDSVPFLLVDRGSELLVELPDATLRAFEVKWRRSEGSRTWEETRLDVGDRLHAYGEVRGDFTALERSEPPRLCAGDDGVLRLTMFGAERLHGVDQLWVVLYGLLGGLLCSAGLGFALSGLVLGSGGGRDAG